MTILPFAGRSAAAAPTRGHPATRHALSVLRARLRARANERRLRRDYAAMLQLDAAILRDIGVTRGEICWAASLPLSVDSKAAIDAQRGIEDEAA